MIVGHSKGRLRVEFFPRAGDLTSLPVNRG